MRPGFDSRIRRHMWVEFVAGSLPCSKAGFFSGFSGSPPYSKTNTSKFQFDLEFEIHLNNIWQRTFFLQRSNCNVLGLLDTGLDANEALACVHQIKVGDPLFFNFNIIVINIIFLIILFLHF